LPDCEVYEPAEFSELSELSNSASSQLADRLVVPDYEVSDLSELQILVTVSNLFTGLLLHLIT